MLYTQLLVVIGTKKVIIGTLRMAL